VRIIFYIIKSSSKSMVLRSRIMEISPNEMKDLNVYIQEFIQLFPSHPSTQADFINLETSKKATVRILCKLSEWCNAKRPRDQQGKDLAANISKILFGEIIPKLDGYELKEFCEFLNTINVSR
ncbi:MAG: hypothetical protein Q7U60_02670, partial [Candidatus Methanoperedens sp.]|nr:hypothetical protein [Candidatus Methanoperedens sp.]